MSEFITANNVEWSKIVTKSAYIDIPSLPMGSETKVLTCLLKKVTCSSSITKRYFTESTTGSSFPKMISFALASVSEGTRRGPKILEMFFFFYLCGQD